MSLTTILIIGFLVWLILGRGVFFQTFYDLIVQTGIFYFGLLLILFCGAIIVLIAFIAEDGFILDGFSEFFDSNVRPQMWNSIFLNIIVLGVIAGLYFLI